MKWIDEMFMNMEKQREAETAQRTARAAQAGRTQHSNKQTPGALVAWGALLSTITTDVDEFNHHKKRAGQTAVRISHRPFECQVYVPGMHGTKLDLKLADGDLQVTVHPDFPDQQLTITVESETEGLPGFWVLGGIRKESGKVTVQQLSEYLLKPILASAEIDGDVQEESVTATGLLT